MLTLEEIKEDLIISLFLFLLILYVHFRIKFFANHLILILILSPYFVKLCGIINNNK